MGGDNGVRGVFIVEGSNGEEKQQRNAWQPNCSLARIGETFRRQYYPKPAGLMRVLENVGCCTRVFR